MANGSTFIDGVLRTNGFSIGSVNEHGVRLITREVSSLRTMKTYVITITDPQVGDPTLTVTGKEDQHLVAVKTDTWAEIGSDAIVMVKSVSG